MITIPRLKFPQMQNYILHHNCSYADKITTSIKEVENYFNMYPNANIKVKSERNYYGLTDYRFILTE